MSASDTSLHRPAHTGLLLIGHGTREPAGVQEFLATARLVESQAAGAAVQPCFLEFAEPTIAAGCQALERRGVRHMVAAPVLLFAAGHAKRDIPDALAAAADASGLRVALCEHLGCHDAILRASAERFDEAIAKLAEMDNADTALVVVGRGSHDESATREMQRFVELRSEASGLLRTTACFVAMAEPGLTEVLDEAAASGARRIVVQPHLLFGGVLLERISQTVEQYASRFPRQEWIATSHLGPTEWVAKAILARAMAAPTAQAAR